jgi:hypothetical protein
MRRAGLLAVAAAAVSLCGFSSVASAAPPAWHYCAKATPKNTGSYSDKSCSLASEPGKGSYELFAGVGKGKAFKGKGGSGRQILIVIPGKAELHLECAKSALTGHPVAPSGVKGVVITYSKCTMLGAPCKSEGSPKGTVHTETLSGELGWLNKVKGMAGVSLSNEVSPGTGYVVMFGCEFNPGEVVGFRSFGAFIGEIATTGAVGKEFLLDYSTGQYVEEPNEPTNPPEFEERFVGTLQSEYNSVESGFEWVPPGGLRGGLEHGLAVKGEALSIS